MVGRTFVFLIKNAGWSEPIRKIGRKAKLVTKRVVTVSGAGAIAYYGYNQWDRVRERRENKAGVFREADPFGPWKLMFYVKLVPRKIQSRIWGFLNELTLPTFLRQPLIGCFAYFYECDLSEALEPNLQSYSNLSQFFRRSLKPGLRPIAPECLVSPADGRVTRFGEVIDDRIEQVKGITYDVSSFIGRDLASQYKTKNQNMKRYYCVVYLAPGDYHGFHSPADWHVNFRRHFSGHLLGVSDRVMRRVANLFCINERVLMTGRWQYGFFTMTCVGATNVGNIALDFEKTLMTNQPFKRHLQVDDLSYENKIEKQRGERIGEFRFGSSIVLFFEAPSTFKFNVKQNQKVKFGEALGHC